MSGTVNISRDLWDDKAFKPEPFTEREAWVWMIMEASYKKRSKPVGNLWVDLERGQLACSVRFMCDAWQWSKSRVDRFLKRLENRDMIGTDSGTGVNVITICKYNEYQNKPKDSGTDENENRDSSGTAAGQQRDKPNKGVIQDVIQVKENKIAFSEFWSAWPVKKSKQDAERAWKKISREDQSEALSAVRCGWFEKWQADNPQANPIHASRFLNAKRWTDEFTPNLKTINGGRHDNRPDGADGLSRVISAAAEGTSGKDWG